MHPAASSTSSPAHNPPSLKKVLGLGDLVLTQILCVVGSMWVGTAAKLGPSHTVFWLLALTFFYLPLSAVVIYLNRIMPLEGGLYQWAKLGFNEFAGFLVGWNLWLYAILLISSFGVMLCTNLAYAFGPRFEWMGSNQVFIVAVSSVLVAGLAAVATLGLGVGKWIQNAGGVTQLITFGVLLLLPFLTFRQHGLDHYHAFPLAIPAISLFSLNIFGKMAMGALSGFEYVAILAGECRNPVRTIGLSVVIAAPIIALMFIFGTSSILAFFGPSQIDLVGPIPQALSAGLGRLGIAGPIGAVVILLLAGRQIGAASLTLTGCTRLPMVAGWDHLLPAWFTRLHPRYRTPINSILFVSVMALALVLLGLTGVGYQEAFQLLDNASGIFYGIAYLFMFAIPIWGFRNGKHVPPAWLRCVAVSGFAVTLLYCVLSVFPIIDVPSWFQFGAKIGGVILGANLLGAFLYAFGSRRLSSKGSLVGADKVSET